MIEKQLDELATEIGGMKEFQSLYVRVYLKETDAEVGTATLQGHIPATSFVSRNILTLYTTAALDMPSYLIPPPMVRFIEVVRESGKWGVQLLGYREKIQCIKSLRDAIRTQCGEVPGLKECKDMVESCPVVVAEGLEEAAARVFLKTLNAGGSTCKLLENGVVTTS